MSSTDFDQVRLWDITTRLGLTDSTDKAALVNRGNIMIDARSYGIYYDVTRDKLLIQNIAHAFELRSGGLWVGVDHAATWTKNGNALLMAMGYSTVSGIYYSAITGGDTTSELLTTPNVITPSDMWVASVGKAPTGVQSDGVNLKPLLWSDDTTYTSYALRPIAPAPEFPTIALPALMMVFGATLLIIRRRKGFQP